MMRLTKKIKVRVQHRRMSAAEWQLSDDVLLAGEIGVESDTGLVKAGDGERKWRELGYLSLPTGPQGEQGEKGDPLVWDDLTEDQKKQLKGERGERGPQGKPLTWDDLTSEQKQGLKGETGNRGPKGAQGERGLQGAKGDTGEQGPKGDVGPRGKTGDRGPAGPALTVASHQILKNGNLQLTLSDKTVVEVPKGPKGDVRFEDLSQEQLKQVLAGVLAEYASKQYVDKAVANVEVDLSGYAKKSELPRNYLTKIPADVVRKSQIADFITLADVSDLASERYVNSEIKSKTSNVGRVKEAGTSRFYDVQIVKSGNIPSNTWGKIVFEVES